MKIGVIVGSTRRGRKGDQVGHWVARRAAEQNTAQGGQAEFEVIDLADHRLGFYEDEVHPAGANKQYSDPATQAWSDRIDGFDAYIFVTPEYNHSVPAPMKNAFDMLFHEWARKAVAFVSYGDRKSTRLNSSHVAISYAVFCLKKKKKRVHRTSQP